jgi:hypothetical protein
MIAKNAPPAQAWWHSLMATGGLVFGLLGDRRPFGADVLAHPFVVYFAAVAAALLVLRVVGARPVPQFLPERTLVIGCLLGAVAFLGGNWVATRLPLG